MSSSDSSGNDRPRRSSTVRAAAPWVVVFDSYPVAHSALVELLLDAGFAVKGCNDLHEVLAAAQSGRRIHCLLIELKAGSRVVERVRQHQPDVRVLFMSGRDSLPEGVVGEFVKKPIDFDALVHRLRYHEDADLEQTGRVRMSS